VITDEKLTTLTLLSDASVIENGSSKSYRQWPSILLFGVSDIRLSTVSGGRGTLGFSPGFIASVSYNTHVNLSKPVPSWVLLFHLFQKRNLWELVQQGFLLAEMSFFPLNQPSALVAWPFPSFTHHQTPERKDTALTLTLSNIKTHSKPTTSAAAGLQPFLLHLRFGFC